MALVYYGTNNAVESQQMMQTMRNCILFDSHSHVLVFDVISINGCTGSTSLHAALNYIQALWCVGIGKALRKDQHRRHHHHHKYRQLTMT